MNQRRAIDLAPFFFAPAGPPDAQARPSPRGTAAPLSSHRALRACERCEELVEVDDKTCCVTCGGRTTEVVR